MVKEETLKKCFVKSQSYKPWILLILDPKCLFLFPKYAKTITKTMKWTKFFNIDTILPGFGKYRKKSNEIPLQLHDIKSIFQVTITLSENVFEFMSKLILSKESMSKYFTP